jgi:hypothetical protein
MSRRTLHHHRRKKLSLRQRIRKDTLHYHPKSEHVSKRNAPKGPL